jgi:hypothetical protein
MSILQEYDLHRKIIGRRKLLALDFYLKNVCPYLNYEKIIYNKSNYEEFEKWYKCYNHNIGKSYDSIPRHEEAVSRRCRSKPNR